MSNDSRVDKRTKIGLIQSSLHYGCTTDDDNVKSSLPYLLHWSPFCKSSHKDQQECYRYSHISLIVVTHCYLLLIMTVKMRNRWHQVLSHVQCSNAFQVNLKSLLMYKKRFFMNIMMTKFVKWCTFATVKMKHWVSCFLTHISRTHKGTQF